MILALSPVLSAAGDNSIRNIKRDYDLILKNHAAADTAYDNGDKLSLSKGSELGTAAAGLIKVYQVFLSSQDAPVCNYSPSCSRFTAEAIQKVGFIRGSLLGADRLLRCHRWTKRYYRIINDFRPEQVPARIIDPPGRYTD
jgi:putative membrane protein insertion efficiency factor